MANKILFHALWFPVGTLLVLLFVPMVIIGFIGEEVMRYGYRLKKIVKRITRYGNGGNR